MNTILTDDELPPLQPQDHPEPHSMRWSDAELRAIRARDRLVEAAVLAKLREQEPIYQIKNLSSHSAWHDATKDAYQVVPPAARRIVYAAPQPVVMQVPHAEQAAEAVRVTEFNVGRWCMSEDDCIAEGIDFSAYERGVADAANAFGKNVAAAPLPAVVQVPQGIDVDGRRIAAEAENHACSLAVWMTRMDAESPDADDLGVSGWLQEAEKRIKRRMLAAAPEAPATAVVQVPQGWRLVPVEPTERMCKAAADAWLDCHSKMVLNKAGAASKAAIAAAPEAPAPAVVQVPQGTRTVPLEKLDDWRQRVNTLAALSTKADRHKVGVELKQSIRDVMNADPEAPAQGDPLEKLTRIQEELRLYDDKPAQRPVPYAYIVELPAGEYVGTAKHFTAPSDPRGRPVYLHPPIQTNQAQPSVPAPWREAVKVAREALLASDAMITDLIRDEFAGLGIHGEALKKHVAKAREMAKPDSPHGKVIAAVARIDALEGGE